MFALVGVGACDEYVGCAPVLTTQDGQLEFHDQAITVGACLRLRHPAPLLEGARWCPAVRCGTDVEGCEDDDDEKIPDAAVAACFDSELSGPVLEESPCLRMSGPGEASWVFTAVPCAASDRGYAPASDHIEWSVLSVDEVSAHLQSPGDAFALRSLLDVNGDPLSDGDALAPGDIAHAVAGSPVPFAVVLRHPDHDAAVGWNPTNWEIEVEATTGPAPKVEFEDLGLLTVTIDAGAEARISIVPGPDAMVQRTIEVGVVAGVAAEDLVSLEVLAAYAPAPEDSDLVHGPVAGARAIVRDDRGVAVYGAEVTWSVLDGALPVWRDASIAWTADYVALAERDGASCHEPPERSQRYDATIEAQLGDLSGLASVSWTELPPESGLFGGLGELFSDPPGDSENCLGPGFPAAGGCSCTTSDRSPVGLGVFVLLALGLARRRRAGARVPWIA
ncbi:MAG: hypothetical protein JKY37_19730 [Nannocystaceae bacterium]|nr:hypothetical protein [Nannocystaceae bacterium]